MLSFDEAIALLRRSISPLGTEYVPLAEAAGRYLAEDLKARFDAPRSDVSAMDGYAVDAAGLDRVNGFAVVGEARPGEAFGMPLGEAEAFRIFTGAPVPRGANCVVMQEYARHEGERVFFEDGHGPARHIRTAGSDFRAGDLLLAKGARLSPRAMVAAGAADREDLTVGKSPRIAIIATGDELVAPGKAHQSGSAIPESASFGVAAMAEAMGGEIVMRLRGRDDLAELEALAARALDAADCVVVTGGASVGDHDLARPMFAALDLELVFARVAIKPGKPVWLGRARGKPVLGLPGNPSSAMVTARLFVCPLLALLQGGDGTTELDFSPMPLAGPLPATSSRETFIRASSGPRGLSPLSNQESGAQHPLVAADRLIRRSAHSSACDAGTLVDTLPF